MPDDDTDYIGDALAESRARQTGGQPPPSRPREPGTSPGFVIVAGVLTMIVGMVVSLGGQGFAVAGVIVGAVGTVVAGVGVVAAGVRLGTEWADHDRATRER